MPLYTIGHSSHTTEKLFSLLTGFEIKRLIDIRSVPYSGRFPCHSRDNLQRLCAERGIKYVWRGDSLGGLRDDTSGFEEIRTDSKFIEALKELASVAREGAVGMVTCLICAEWDPSRCHRSKLIGTELRKLPEGGVDLHHILRDGTLILQSELERDDPGIRPAGSDRAGTLSLFDNGNQT
jgi:uncharacterized protein (DUF488 family)